MEGHFLTGQSPQRAVVPMEDEEEEEEEEEYTSVSEDADNRSLKNTGIYLQTYSTSRSIPNFLLQFVDKLPFLDW